MTKKSIIISSILLSIVALMAILFGAVFRLRNVSVEVQPGANITVTNDKIVESANLKKGKSIFMLDKQSAINNIEQTYAEIKVVQIKTTNLMSVKIIVRERKEMFYAEHNSSYYCLDEDLKVQRLTEVEPTNLIKITTDIGITSNTKKCDFMSQDYAKITYNMFVGMYTNVKVEGRYAERDDMCNLVESIEIKTAHALTEDGNGGFEYTNLILKTRAGVVMQIANPNTDLGRKINICFAAYFNPAVDNTKGRIVIKYDGTNVYLPND
mgnify:FL=1